MNYNHFTAKHTSARRNTNSGMTISIKSFRSRVRVITLTTTYDKDIVCCLYSSTDCYYLSILATY